MLSFIIGIIRMGLDFGLPAPVCGSGESDKRPSILSKVDFLHFAAILGLFTTVAMVIISLLTDPRPPQKVNNTQQKRNTLMILPLYYNAFVVLSFLDKINHHVVIYSHLLLQCMYQARNMSGHVFVWSGVSI